MRGTRLAACAVSICAGLSNAQPVQVPAPLDAAFEKQARAYEALDKIEPPPKGAILLAGDSQFFRWKTFREDLPGYTVINRGIDSFQTSDLARFADRLVLPYRPRLIVLHVGGNDVHNGKTSDQVLADFKTFVAKVHDVLPGVPLAFTSITPGPGRWDERDRRRSANAVLKNYIATQPGLHFINLWDAMLTPDGKPREDLWVEDRVHPNHAGYIVRASVMRPFLGAPDHPSLLPNVTSVADETLDLWPGVAPGETEKMGRERVVTDRPRPFDQITDVTVPTLSVFQPSAQKRTGTGVLLIPGGGLERLAIESEGYEAAEWLTEHGITAFLLKYRVPTRDPSQPWKAGLQDAQRAMGLIRANASKWKVDADAIGSIGFSAGAWINVMLSVYHAEARQYPLVDSADALSTRPDFNVAVYGGGFTDPRTNALFNDIATRLGETTPPMFIAHAFDDQALNSVALMAALKRANVPSELHIFGAGGHGFGVRDSGLPVGDWRDLCLNWLTWQGFMDAPSVRAYAKEFVAARDQGAATLPRFSATRPKPDHVAAYAVQNRVVRHNIAQGDEVIGYLGGQTASAEYGVLFKRGRIEAGNADSILLDPVRPVSIEASIGYVIAVDIGTKVRGPRQALTSVEAVVPMVDLPLNVASLMGGHLSIEDGIAANFGSRRFIVGAPVPPATLGNPGGLKVSMKHNGQESEETTSAATRPSQADILMILINRIIDQGHVIHRGDILSTGTMSGAQPGAAGRYTADFGALGTITFELK
ncbi:MAG: GDSL-type esterase/lipase family protein [Vicinamibacteria bacterium]